MGTTKIGLALRQPQGSSSEDDPENVANPRIDRQPTYEREEDITKIDNIPTLITRIFETGIDSFTDEFLSEWQIKNQQSINRDCLILGTPVFKEAFEALFADLGDEKQEILGRLYGDLFRDPDAEQLIFKNDINQLSLDKILGVHSLGERQLIAIRQIYRKSQALRTDYVKKLSIYLGIPRIEVDESQKPFNLAVFKRSLVTSLYQSIRQNPPPSANTQAKIKKLVDIVMKHMQSDLSVNLEQLKQMEGRVLNQEERMQAIYVLLQQRTFDAIARNLIRGQRGILGMRSVKTASGTVENEFELRTSGVTRYQLGRVFFPNRIVVQNSVLTPLQQDEARLEEQVKAVYGDSSKDTIFSIITKEVVDGVEKSVSHELDLTKYDDVCRLNQILREQGSQYQLHLFDGEKACILCKGVVDDSVETQRTFNITKEIFASPGLRLLGCVWVVERDSMLMGKNKFEIFVRDEKMEEYMKKMLDEAFKVEGGLFFAREIFRSFGIHSREAWDNLKPDERMDVFRTLIDFVQIHEQGHIEEFTSEFPHVKGEFPISLRGLTELYANFGEKGVLGEIVRGMAPGSTSLINARAMYFTLLNFFERKASSGGDEQVRQLADFLKMGLDDRGEPDLIRLQNIQHKISNLLKQVMGSLEAVATNDERFPNSDTKGKAGSQIIKDFYHFLGDRDWQRANLTRPLPVQAPPPKSDPAAAERTGDPTEKPCFG